MVWLRRGAVESFNSAFDYEYDFLDELSHIFRKIYGFVNVEVLNKRELPEHIILGPRSLFAILVRRV
jgi:hypothetical protein